MAITNNDNFSERLRLHIEIAIRNSVEEISKSIVEKAKEDIEKQIKERVAQIGIQVSKNINIDYGQEELQLIIKFKG